MTVPGDPDTLLRRMFAAAVDSARPERCLPPALPCPPRGRTVVVGAGKAAAAMAAVVERHWTGPLSGVVVTRHGHGVSCERIAVVEAGHPVPDAASVDGAAMVLAAVEGLTADDLVLCLISGGGSALLAALPPGVALADEQALTVALLRSGAPIDAMNRVRRHVSLIRGGRLAIAARPAMVVTLAISDVPGDDPAAIASGPTIADPSTRADALAVLARYGIAPPPAIAAWLAEPGSESPPAVSVPGRHAVVASAGGALAAAAAVAEAAGVRAIVLGDRIEGEAREVAGDHAAAAREALARGEPCVLLSGGETTVTVRGPGRGGRNAEFLLAFGLALGNLPGVWALAADTDGIDGSEDNAGAIWTPATPRRARELGIDAARHLAANDSYGFFAGVGGLLVTGPTRTNVNDVRVVLIAPGHHHGKALA